MLSSSCRIITVLWYVRSVFTWLPVIFRHLAQRVYYRWSASAKLSAAQFLIPPLPLLLGGPWVRWGRPTCSPTVRTLSKMVKKPQWSWPDHLPHSQSLLLCLPVKHFGHPPGGLLLELQILLKSGVNHFSRLIMSLSNFSRQSFSTSGHYWRWKPLQWDFSDEMPPLPVLLLCLLIITYSCNSYHGLVMVHHIDNFLNILTLFLAVASNFMKSLWQRLEGGKSWNKIQSQNLSAQHSTKY